MPFWVNAQQHEPWHRHMAAEHEFAEIFVLCEQNAVFLICSAQTSASVIPEAISAT